MECGRENGISCQENNRRRSTRRMYECTFCKRGFTNAQALGGHMNIHRRDRAKAKQNNNTSTSNNNNNNNNSLEELYCLNPRSYNGARTYIQSSGLSSPMQTTWPRSCPFGFDKDDDQEEVLGANLSLRIGCSIEKDGNQGMIKRGDDLDLELRLGHDP